MPDSIKAIGPVSELATAREHAATHMVWPVGDRRAKHHKPMRKPPDAKSPEQRQHEVEDGPDTAIHHIDILA